jgi:predicted transposase YbfD/YdcC
MKSKPSRGLIDHFLVLPDPRRLNHNTKLHLLIDIVVIAILAVIAGANTFNAIATFGRKKERWLKKFLTLPNGIPSEDTFARVFSLLDPVAFQQCFLSWVSSVYQTTKGEVVAIDGKSVRRSHGTKTKPLHLVNAFATANGLAIGHHAVNQKSNEITAIPELLELLDLKGCIITTDAMGTQRWIIKKILKKGADYLLAVKGNQRRLHRDIKKIITEADSSQLEYYRLEETDRGRHEVRECWLATDLTSIRDDDRWDELAAVAEIKLTRTVRGKTSSETRHYITSLTTSAKDVLTAARSHWQVENRLHWVLDVIFNEDESRVRTGHAQENLAVVRKLALNLLRQLADTTGGLQNKRMQAAWDENFLLKVAGLQMLKKG